MEMSYLLATSLLMNSALINVARARVIIVAQAMFERRSVDMYQPVKLLGPMRAVDDHIHLRLAIACKSRVKHPPITRRVRCHPWFIPISAFPCSGFRNIRTSDAAQFS